MAPFTTSFYVYLSKLKKEIPHLMENYLVSARKYRPATFDTVVGQEALTETLKNAISTNKLAHAYLFCGPRGVGKTTCARIFAKTINCLHPAESGEACNACESCVAFNEQRSYNIHELDAASNNSVEDIRLLVDMVRIPPQIGKYKVYIIDEVHMLSTAAFNAFLKTLEEPPVHAVFILATTEKHKILPTILSRCQIYDFNRITVSSIVNHLMKVAERESVKVEPEALNVIALKADGGMRDALSIFDQSVSFTRGNITYESVLENLNVLDYEYYFKLTDTFLKNDVVQCLLIFNEILDKGFEGGQFITGLTSHFRDLLVSKDPASLPLLQVGASIRVRYQEQAQSCDSSFLFRAMKLCSDCDLNLRTSKNRRLLTELTLIQIAQITQEDSDSNRPLGQQKIKPLNQQKTTAEPQSTVKTSVQTNNNTSDVVRDSTVNYSSKSNASEPSVKVEKEVASHDSNVLDALKTKPSKRKLPVMNANGLGISIKKELNKPSNTEMNNSTAIRGAVQETIQNTVFDEADLNFQWQSYANRMPIEQKALAVRMQGMRVNLLANNAFEMVVDNELVARDFQTIKSDIEAYMRSELKNDNVVMRVRVSEETENIKVFSRTDRYQFMLNKNADLEKLREVFGLEFS